jgi:hypothetical protein
MQNISITIDTTSDAQDEALAHWLLVRNSDEGRKPLPDVSALLTEVVQVAIEDAVPRYQTARYTCVTDALGQASGDQWLKVADVLGVKLP